MERAKERRKAATLGNGAEAQSRTGDTSIFSAVLYQLSYLGTARRRWQNPHNTRSLDLDDPVDSGDGLSGDLQGRTRRVAAWRDGGQ
jgi:hypothetical protein